MNYETIQLPPHHKLIVSIDETAPMPFDPNYDEGATPIIVLSYESRGAINPDCHGASWDDLCDLLSPRHCRGKANREKLCEILDVSLAELLEQSNDFTGDLPERFCECYREHCRELSRPYSWQDCKDYADRVQALAGHLGIACEWHEVRGYSPGDSAIVIALAMPEWLERTGASPDDWQAEAKGAAELWKAWAYGDVYEGAIYHKDDEGDDELLESCCGFYGSDHEKSGLMDWARDTAEWLTEQAEKERAEREFWAARGVVTAG